MPEVLDCIWLLNVVEADLFPLPRVGQNGVSDFIDLFADELLELERVNVEEAHTLMPAPAGLGS